MDELEKRFVDLKILQQVHAIERAEKINLDGMVGVTKSSAKRSIEQYDVFLAYNSKDEKAVEAVARELLRRGINPWFAKWCVPPGRQFQKEIERAFYSVGSVAVFVGPAGLGPWEDQEALAAIQEFVKRHAPVIPVFLPDVGTDHKLPLFLRGFNRVSFSGSTSDAAALDHLVWGIKGIRDN
jgi:hypothetical protein